MADGRDPVEAASDDGRDLYDIATWEPRTWVDRQSVRVYRLLVTTTRSVVVLLALVILLSQFALMGAAAASNPAIAVFIALSVVPAAVIAAYVRRSDVTGREPLGLLVGTFLLGILFASFAAVLNAAAEPAFRGFGLVGMALFFFLVVGPVEETVKWLAIRLHAYRSDSFRAVVDGAVYGAAAGLGFATIENALFISQQFLQAAQSAGTTAALFDAALPTAAVRTFAGPGHVIYSAFAGYYLGLAKYNRENAGPIVVKGILVAAFIHGLYNISVTVLPGLVAGSGLGIGPGVAFLGFVVVYDGLFLWILLRKLRRYGDAFHATGAAA
ncbi:MAG: PrsW family glutamic-type intramembrane protease [Halobacteriales archaeon]|nr:PrsW family glutamic-type intramembrane protease [Halobacteriales archaeon]